MDDGKRPRNQAVDISEADQLGCAPLHLHQAPREGYWRFTDAL